MERLSSRTLAQAPPAVARPAHDRAALRTGIAHLGLGAFARVHLVDYTDDALAAEPGDWGVCGVSMRRRDAIDDVAPQDGLYSIAVRDADGARLRIAGALTEWRCLPDDPAGLVARMADPAIRIVTATVTEKGYCHDPASGRLNETHPDILHDLATPHAPRSAIGVIVAALQARRDAGLAPSATASLDNLPANGRTLRGLAIAFAALRDDRLASWIEAEAEFPCSMVDRIAPAATDADRAAAAAALGLVDHAAVTTEPFRQWVIEDRFPLGRPRWDLSGAEMVADVAAHEFMKLRMLNGAHSSLAYLGYLAGHETVADASGDPVLAAFLEGLWREIAPTVPAPPGVDLNGYADALLRRFRNPAIRHRVWQIAMDGSQKLPQRLLGTIRDRLAAGAPVAHLATGVAAWMAYVAGLDEAGRTIDVRDPLAPALRAACDAAGGDPARRVEALLGFDAVFGRDLPANADFRRAVTAALGRLMTHGARAAAAAARAA